MLTVFSSFILSLLAAKLIEVTIKQQHNTIQLMWHQYLWQSLISYLYFVGNRRNAATADFSSILGHLDRNTMTRQ
jgi:hypothetical protein